MYFSVFFQGIPLKDGKGCFHNLDELSIVLASIVYTCSVGHAASNFPQYEEYGFPAHYPAYMKGPVPTSKVRIQETARQYLTDYSTKKLRTDTWLIRCFVFKYLIRMLHLCEFQCLTATYTYNWLAGVFFTIYQHVVCYLKLKYI